MTNRCNVDVTWEADYGQHSPASPTTSGARFRAYADTLSAGFVARACFGSRRSLVQIQSPRPFYRKRPHRHLRRAAAAASASVAATWMQREGRKTRHSRRDTVPRDRG